MMNNIGIEIKKRKKERKLSESKYVRERERTRKK